MSTPNELCACECHDEFKFRRSCCTGEGIAHHAIPAPSVRASERICATDCVRSLGHTDHCRDASDRILPHRSAPAEPRSGSAGYVAEDPKETLRKNWGTAVRITRKPADSRATGDDRCRFAECHCKHAEMHHFDVGNDHTECEICNGREFAANDPLLLANALEEAMRWMGHTDRGQCPCECCWAIVHFTKIVESARTAPTLTRSRLDDAMIERIVAAVPNNWVDSILTGPSGVFSKPRPPSAPLTPEVAVEEVCVEIRKAIRAAAKEEVSHD